MDNDKSRAWDEPIFARDCRSSDNSSIEETSVRYGFSDDPTANRAHYDVIRRLTTAQRARQGMLLSRWNRGMTLGHIREDHPEYADEDVRLAYCRKIMTDDEFTTLFPEHADRFPKTSEEIAPPQRDRKDME